jgi:hypothetical protein
MIIIINIHRFYICQDDCATMWQLGEAPEKCTCLAKIETFLRQESSEGVY